MRKGKIPKPKVEEEINIIPGKVQQKATACLAVDFSKFKLSSISIQDKFNNHFKDGQHFIDVIECFLGTVLPKLTSHTYSQICQGTREGEVLHFHTVDDSHREIVRKILEEYGFPKQTVDQMFDGDNIIEFSIALGHTYPARCVCHKIDNVLELLFFDTNHHVYFNAKYGKESLFYNDCPDYIAKKCNYMPDDCYAVSYLDEKKLMDSFGYSWNTN